MKIFVTGASGFVGMELCRQLSHSGHHVVAAIRTPSDHLKSFCETRVIHNYSDQALLAKSLKGCDAVVHLAGRAHILKDSSENPIEEFRHVNVRLTEILLRTSIASGIKRFVYVSSIGVHGNRTYGVPFSESDVVVPHDSYAISKWEAEQLVSNMARAGGIEYVIARPVLMFGPHAPGNFAVLLKIAASGLPLPFAGLSKRRNLLSIWNFVDFLQVCLLHPHASNETFVVADTQSVSLSEIFKSLGEGTGRPQRLLTVPHWLLSGICRVLGKSEMLRKIDAELLVSTRKAVELLGWIPPMTTEAALVKAGRAYMERKM